MRFGQLQPIHTLAFVLPLQEAMDPYLDTFQWLDEYVPSSYALLGHLLIDTFLNDERMQGAELNRAFWNLYEATQKGLIVDGEVPDRIMEAMEVICDKAIAVTYNVKDHLTLQHGHIHSGSHGILLPSYGLNLIVQISLPR